MLAAMAFPASASAYELSDSVGSNSKYKIYFDSNNKLYTPEISETEVEAGSTYTFVAPDDILSEPVENAGFFNWMFYGDYEVVKGNVYESGFTFDKTVTLKPLSDIYAVVCFETDNDHGFYFANIETNNDAYEPDYNSMEIGVGEYAEFSVPDDIPDFLRWEFSEGNYEVIKGSVDKQGYSKDRTVVLKLWSGVTGFARFGKEAGNEPTGENKPTEEPTTISVGKNGDNKGGSTSDQVIKNGVKTDTSSTSPKTGSTASLIVCVMILSAFICLSAVRKARKN